MVNRISNLGVCMLTAILILAILLSGCQQPSRFIRVQSRVGETTRDNINAEVTKTPLYSRMVSQIKSVALSAPSSCANELASSRTGSAVSVGALLRTSCGVEMAEIERALVSQGFTVYSWAMLNEAIINNKSENAIVVAKKLGAQVLFQVNSLERVIMIPGQDISRVRSYSLSNASGEILSPVSLNDRQINQIKDVINPDEVKRLPSLIKRGAMLDINAVDTTTGQTMWFYRWTKHEDISKNAFASYLLQCWDHWGCLIESGQLPESSDDESKKRSSEEAKISIAPTPASEKDAKYYELLRDVTADFAKRFSSGQ